MFGLEKSRELKDVSGRDKEYGARIETDCQRVSKIVGNAKTLTLSLSNGVIIPSHPCRICENPRCPVPLGRDFADKHEVIDSEVKPSGLTPQAKSNDLPCALFFSETYNPRGPYFNPEEGSERSGQLKDVSGRDKEYGARIETDCQRVSKIVGNAAQS